MKNNHNKEIEDLQKQNAEKCKELEMKHAMVYPANKMQIKLDDQQKMHEKKILELENIQEIKIHI